ncbi:putative secreted protein [Streptococcus cristatus]|uniref:Putative secreted protein n=2 Tax=Streptococcus cristatus TaxID=45634 RepID=A0A139MZC0_STRCR|nr:putative secreted protein [Streptococcus cristatus]
MNKQTQEEKLREEMLKVVKSDEAKEVFERTIKNIDPIAFSDQGVIQSYDIDYDSIKHNPMGGISVKIIINKNKELYIQNILEKETNGKLRNASGSSSVELDKLLEAKE